MRSSYSEDDVILLLKDITGLVEPLGAEEREFLVQSGRHYSEMLPIEYVPGPEYMAAYEAALDHFAAGTADAVGRLAGKVMMRRGRDVVLVSLARAGIPVGILLKRYLRKKYGIDAAHYSISIIRDRGIDNNAVRYLLQRYRAEDILFVDGWTGKGAILKELQKSTVPYDRLSPELAVAADPANVTDLCGTHEDLLIPSSCLNCTVSGLISRTFLRDDIIGPDDFHGALYYGEMRESDVSYDFIDRIEARFDMGSADLGEAEERQNRFPSQHGPAVGARGIDEVRRIAQHFGVADMNLIKPGIGEATRVLLRRVPWKVLVAEGSAGDPALDHLMQLAYDKNVEVEYYPLVRYKACGIIRRMADT